MDRIRIDEIVESLEGIVEYMGEQTHVDPIPHVETEQFLWTCLRDLARIVKDITSTPEDSEEDATQACRRSLVKHFETCSLAKDPGKKEEKT